MEQNEMAQAIDETRRLLDAATLLFNDFKRRRGETERELDRQEFDLKRNVQYYEFRLSRLTGRAAQPVPPQPVASPKPAQTEVVAEPEAYGIVTQAAEDAARLAGHPFNVNYLAKELMKRQIRSDMHSATISARNALKGLLKRKIVKPVARGLFEYTKRETQERLGLP